MYADIPELEYDESLDLFEDMGFDSVKWLALLDDIENEFGIVLDDEFIFPENLRHHKGIVSMLIHFAESATIS